MPRNHDEFQLELSNTAAYTTCNKCTKNINQFEDPEHVILWPPNHREPWRMHIICFGDLTAGMVEFFKVFVVKKQKKVLMQ